jgi:PAS domain S-box-containing protein
MLVSPIQFPNLSDWQRWWRNQTPYRQDRYAMLAPLAAVILFLVAIVAVFGYLRLEEIAREKEAVQRDVEYAQQKLRLRLLDRQEELMRVARDLSNREMDVEEFRGRAQSMIGQYPELQSLSWVDERKKLRARVHHATLSNGSSRSALETNRNFEVENNFNLARELAQALYIQSHAAPGESAALLMLIPLAEGVRFRGFITAEYSIEGLYRYGIAPELTTRYAVALMDAKGEILAGSTLPTYSHEYGVFSWSHNSNDYEMPVSPVGSGLVLRAQAYRNAFGVIGSGLFWLVIALSLMTAWMLIGNWRHTRRRNQAQQALVAETNFRRAMENSMPTGMRALDLQGRITYVNAALCNMTGWTEAELVGKTAPFPYWPDEDIDILTARLEDELNGRAKSGGFQVRIKRRDSSIFDARIYISPLIDARGLQTGWMTSVTDITEPNRVRQQLSASYERFTTVLEALDASVSVAPLGSDELLFANKLYRLWFQDQSRGHVSLAARAGLPRNQPSDEALDQVDSFAGMPIDNLSDNDIENTEIYVESLKKWLEIRTRYLTWVDGRLAQMVIATDITPRRIAEEQSMAQTERAQTASRLITMGEMASSVAHELNQPLTAINNYCNGMVSRIKAKQISDEDLLAALEKTAHQAQRAGQIIQRIRAFVKRSEPNRSLSSIDAMVSEAIELAEIELRRFNVRLTHVVSDPKQQLLVDPILIEQVLVNLLKNAAESIDAAHRATESRVIDMRVMITRTEGKKVAEFTVIDTGKGIAPEVMDRLYEAFFSTKADGMGIGLSLCRSIVESHQGRMKAENIYNDGVLSGCRFSFWIPLTEAARKPAALLPQKDRISG